MQPVSPVAEIYRQDMGSQQRQGEAVPWVAYDTEQYTSTATTQLNFFRTAKASRLASNMEQAGAFPFPQIMHVFSIGILPMAEPGALETAAPNLLSNFYRLLFNSYSEFKVGHKLRTLAPSICFPAGLGLNAAIGGAGGEATDEFVINATNGLPAPIYRWWFEKGVMIESMQKFEFNMYWDAAQTLTGNLDIKVLFYGRLIRSVQ